MEIYYHDDVGVSIRPSVVFTGLDGSPTWNVENASFVAYKPGGSGSVPSMHQSGSMGPLGSGSWPADPVGDVMGLYYADIWVPVPWAETYKGTWIVYMEAQILPDNTRVGTTVTFAVDRYSPGKVYDRVGAPVAASVSADIAVVDAIADNIQTRVNGLHSKIDLQANRIGDPSPDTITSITQAIEDKTDNLPADPASSTNVTDAVDTLNGASDRDLTEVYDLISTVDGKVGEPATNLAAYLSSIDTNVGVIKDDTDKLFDLDMGSPGSLTDGSFADRLMNKDGTKSYDESTDSLEALRVTLGNPAAGSIADDVHTIYGHTRYLFSDSIAPPFILGAESFADRLMNKDGSQTFDRSTDSLEAVRDRLDAIFSGVGAAVWGYTPRTLTAISSTLAATIWDVLASAVGGAGTMGQKLLYILDGDGLGQHAPFDPTTDSLADIRQTAECLAATGALPPWSEFS